MPTQEITKVFVFLVHISEQARIQAALIHGRSESVLLVGCAGRSTPSLDTVSSRTKPLLLIYEHHFDFTF